MRLCSRRGAAPMLSSGTLGCGSAARALGAPPFGSLAGVLAATGFFGKARRGSSTNCTSVGASKY